MNIEDIETGYLTISKAALSANYHYLNSTAADAECSAVIKADAYGLGLIPVAQCFKDAGCRTFFVATIKEGLQLRQLDRDITIYVLNGLFPNTEEVFASSALRPVLGSTQQILDWSSYCRQIGTRLEAAIHLDTGINRLGLGETELKELLEICDQGSDLLANFKLSLVMSHLSCADQAAHHNNQEQLDKFIGLKSLLPKAPASLSNSAGILLGPEYHFDLVRPGIALYGSWPLSDNSILSKDRKNLNCVVNLYGRIAQVREIKSGQSVGYGADFKLKHPARVATVTIGYADGYLRKLGAQDEHFGGQVYAGGSFAPVIGRVSMDLITVDITHLPEAVIQLGQFVELIGPHVNIDRLGDCAETISYEILTRLGQRFKRHYI